VFQESTPRVSGVYPSRTKADSYWEVFRVSVITSRCSGSIFKIKGVYPSCFKESIPQDLKLIPTRRFLGLVL
jgi:hypothetical protein